eukprot:756795-Hanusia_phi.AAC.1
MPLDLVRDAVWDSQRIRLAVPLVLIAALALVGLHFVGDHGGSVLMFKNPIGSGDGVVPEKDLSFVKSEQVIVNLKRHRVTHVPHQAHFAASKQLDDVAARSKMNDFFDNIAKNQQMEHVRILNSASSGDNVVVSSLNNYFDKLANKYHSESRVFDSLTAHHAARLRNHPGMLHRDESDVNSHDLNVAVHHVDHLARSSLVNLSVSMRFEADLCGNTGSAETS